MKEIDLFTIIDGFIDNHFYRYALMIDGPWGCGKTWFVEQRLIPHIRDRKYKDAKGIAKKRDLNYISLYGVKSVADISDMLCSQEIEDKVISAVNSQTGQKIIRKPVNKTGRPFQIASLLTDIGIKWLTKVTNIAEEKDFNKLLSLFPDFNNNVIIFDDLERCSCDVNEVLGFINNFVEHSDAKVILVANEEEIGRWHLDNNRELQMLVALHDCIMVDAETSAEKDQRLLQGDRYRPDESHFTPEKLELRRSEIFNENEKYKRIKEKVVGKTIRYEPELKEVFLTLIKANVRSEQLRCALIHEINNLLEYVGRDNHKNIRTFQFFLEKINEIFCAINDQYLTVHLEVVKYCFRSSICWKSGRKKQPAWEDNEEWGEQTFGESEFSSDRQMGFRFIDDLIHTGHLDSLRANDVLCRFENKAIEEGKLMNDPYQHIKGWYEAEDDQVKKWISEIVTNIRSGKYSPSLYPQLTREFVDIQSYGLFTDETKAALNAMAEQLKASKKD